MPPASPPRSMLLVWDGPRPAPDWPAPLAGLPWLGGLVDQSAWAGFAGLEPDFAWGARLGRFWPRLGAAGLAAGALNLPGLWPPPAGPGWCLPCPPPGAARPQMPYLAHPPELSPQSADLAAGLAWFAARRPARPQERDSRFAEVAACARLVQEHADRLAAARPVAWLGVGFAGLNEVCDLFAGLDRLRPRLLLEQLDAYAGRLAARQRAEAVVLLAGAAGALFWAPGRLRPGALAACTPDEAIGLLAGLAGLSPIPGPLRPLED